MNPVQEPKNPTMTAKEFNVFWAKRQRRATIRIFIFSAVVLVALAVLLWLLHQHQSWTHCDRGVECRGGSCRCVE